MYTWFPWLVLIGWYTTNECGTLWVVNGKVDGDATGKPIDDAGTDDEEEADEELRIEPCWLEEGIKVEVEIE